MEKYPSGRRGRFAKPLVFERTARVRIPPSPPVSNDQFSRLVITNTAFDVAQDFGLTQHLFFVKTFLGFQQTCNLS